MGLCEESILSVIAVLLTVLKTVPHLCPTVTVGTET